VLDDDGKPTGELRPTGERDLTDAEFEEQKKLFPNTARPTIVTGTGNVPLGKQIIKLINDRVARKTITYTVAVVYNTSFSQSFTVTQDITNGGGAAVNWLTSYLPPDPE